MKKEKTATTETKHLVLSADEGSVLTNGLNYLQGFMDMLFNSALCLDGFENIDAEGFCEIISEAREKLKALKVVIEKLNAA